MKKLLLVGLVFIALPVMAEKPEWVEEKQGGKGNSGKPAQAQVEREWGDRNGDHRGRDDDRRGDDRRDDGRHSADRYLSTSDRDHLLRRVLTEHYGVEYVSEQKRYKSLPPGLRKKLARGGDLPPGWQDKLVRGEVIDPILYRQAEHLPSDLLNRLTGRQDGIELLRVGDRIVRVMEGRGTVLDVIDLSDRALGLFD